jgi:hypothetical protein
MQKVSLESQLSSKESKTSEAKGKKFLGKAKYALIVPLIIAALACSSGYKKICDSKNLSIYSNSDASAIRIERKLSSARSEVYLFTGHSIHTSLSDLDVNNLNLKEYVNKPFGLFTSQAYKDTTNIVDKDVLKIKGKQGKGILMDNLEHIEEYLKR